VSWGNVRHRAILMDWAVALLLLAAYLARAAGRAPLAVTIPLAVLQTAPLLWRRQRPVAVFAVVVIAGVVAGAVTDEFLGLAQLVALYTLAANVERPLALRLGVVAIVALALPTLRAEQFATGPSLFRLIAFAAAWILGDSLRTRRAYVRELEARAERLEREREENIRRATAEEQDRIARELHDVIAHNVSVILVQATAANHVFDAQPERAREALQSIESTARSALGELRRLLDVVKVPTEERFAPLPGLQRLDDLADQVRGAGLRVVLRVEGTLRDLPAGVDLSAYRIVQEALTNTLNHAHASAAEVTIRRLDGVLELEIVDDGRAHGQHDDQHGQGHGLIGMRERAALLGGEVDAGRTTAGGFRVRARLPIEPEPLP
jgi:signal transduction histidine kinase